MMKEDTGIGSVGRGWKKRVGSLIRDKEKDGVGTGRYRLNRCIMVKGREMQC